MEGFILFIISVWKFTSTFATAFVSVLLITLYCYAIEALCYLVLYYHSHAFRSQRTHYANVPQEVPTMTSAQLSPLGSLEVLFHSWRVSVITDAMLVLVLCRRSRRELEWISPHCPGPSCSCCWRWAHLPEGRSRGSAPLRSLSPLGGSCTARHM